MRKEKIEEINKKLNVFSFGKLQDLITLFDILEREGISLEEVREFIRFSIQIQVISKLKFDKIVEKQRKEWEERAEKCPKCGGPLGMRSITIPKGRGNIHGYKSHHFCIKEDCHYERYSEEKIKILTKKVKGR